MTLGGHATPQFIPNTLSMTVLVSAVAVLVAVSAVTAGVVLAVTSVFAFSSFFLSSEPESLAHEISGAENAKVLPSNNNRVQRRDVLL